MFTGGKFVLCLVATILVGTGFVMEKKFDPKDYGVSQMEIDEFNRKHKHEDGNKCDLCNLHNAAKQGNTKIVVILLTNGVNVNEKDTNELTPIHLASLYGHAEIVQILISNKANVNEKAINKWTPLHIASRYGHTEIVKILISKKANVNEKTVSEWTLLHFASLYGHAEIVQILIKNKANVNEKTVAGWTPLHVTSAHGHTKIVPILITNKANVNEKDTKECTPLHFASQCGHAEIVQILISNKANVNEKDIAGWTPLHLASLNGHTEIVKALVYGGAKINQRIDHTAYNSTPLFVAIPFKMVDAVKMLLFYGADHNIKCFYPKHDMIKPIDRAKKLFKETKEEAYLTIIKLLENAEKGITPTLVELYPERALESIKDRNERGLFIYKSSLIEKFIINCGGNVITIPKFVIIFL